MCYMYIQKFQGFTAENLKKWRIYHIADYMNIAAVKTFRLKLFNFQILLT